MSHATITKPEPTRAELEAENAELRELVRDLWVSCPVSAEDCAACEHKDDEWLFGCALYDRMLELGIEVKG